MIYQFFLYFPLKINNKHFYIVKILKRKQNDLKWYFCTTLIGIKDLQLSEYGFLSQNSLKTTLICFIYNHYRTHYIYIKALKKTKY